MKECKKLITERRAITFFDSAKEISDDLIKEILETASLAPSAYNLQPWKVVVAISKEKKRILKEIAFNQQKVEDASAVIVVIANPKAAVENIDRVLESSIELGYMKKERKEVAKQRILSVWEDQEQAKRKAIRDSALFSMNVMIAARVYGLETHPMDGFDEKKLKEFLNIDEEMYVPMIIAIGYKDPDKALLPRAYRFKFEEFGEII
ncbi:nitroreductase [Thermoanaerobacter sp. YS13]|uniref:nitroreductase family protein n=1 Tax=Thermoanaerobacter sp. YS13 TaxID=1511746 RepID=UPI000575C263|nr:nitroreductase family protein [Thermoanaerobacter sp. YS13]KHO62659.1 nitroreductase [Thermoanaerobacter sp. YS13]